MEASLDAYIKESLSTPFGDDANQLAPKTEMEAAASYSPIDSIVTSWLSVEKAINSALNLGDQEAKNMSMQTRLARLSSLFSLPTSLKSRVKDLYTIRNRVLHRADEVISDEALRLYIENANQAIAELAASHPGTG